MTAYGNLSRLHTLDEQAYRRQLRYIIENIEKNKPVAYGDSDGIATIGIGFNLKIHLISVLKALGLDPERSGLTQAQRQAELGYLAQIRSIVREPWPARGPATEQVARLDSIMAARAQDPLLATIPSRQSSFTMTQSQIEEAFNNIHDVIFDDFDDRLPGFPASTEKAALMSMAWNSPSLIGPNLIREIMSGTRAEAWYQIRYQSNGDRSPGLAGRRYSESRSFGLYDQGPVTQQQALDVYKMFTSHKEQILSYERTYPHEERVADLGYSLPTLDEFLSYARDYLAGHFALDMEIDVRNIAAGTAANLTVSQPRDGGAMLIGLGDGQTLNGLAGKDTALVSFGNGTTFRSGSLTTYMVNQGSGSATFNAVDGRNAMSGGSGAETFNVNINTVDNATVVYGGAGADTFNITGDDPYIIVARIANVNPRVVEQISQMMAAHGGKRIVIINPEADDRIYLNGRLFTSASLVELRNNQYHFYEENGNPTDVIWRIDSNSQDYAYRNGDVWYSGDPRSDAGANDNPSAGYLSASVGGFNAEFHGFVNGDFGITLTGMGSASRSDYYEYYWSGVVEWERRENDEDESPIAGDDFFSYTGLDLAGLENFLPEDVVPGETGASLMALTAEESQNPLFGDENANVLDPVGVYDFVSGGGGGDTILYNRGYGPVAIEEIDDAVAPANTLVFGQGIDPSAVTVTGDREGNLRLLLGGSDEVILIGGLNSAGGTTYGVQSVTFANGTIWTYFDLLTRSLEADSGETSIAGDRTGNQLDSEGIATEVVGGGGGDTFIYQLGYGSLTIFEADTAASPTNALQFGSGIAPSDITVSANSQGDVILELADGARVTLDRALASTGGTRYGIQQIVFAGGTTWSYADLLAAVSSPAAGRNTLFGDTAANLLDGNGQIERIVGRGGGDTIVYEAGDGLVEIEENAQAGSAANTLVFGAGILPGDVTVSGAGDGHLLLALSDDDQILIRGALRGDSEWMRGVQQVTFTNGTTWTYSDLLAFASTAIAGDSAVYGDSGANVLDGAGIAEYMNGGGGGDTFVYQAGYGAIVIDERDASATPDNAIVFGAGIGPGDVSVTGDANGNLILSLSGADRITIVGALKGDGRGVQEVQFSGGTTWSYADLLARALTASATNDALYGDVNANVLDGSGLAGTVSGGGGGDTFIYNLGYGDLVIDQADSSTGPSNMLELGSGIDPDDVSVSGTVEGDLLLTIGSDRITLKGALLSDSDIVYGVQLVSFDNGSTWTYGQLVEMAAAPQSGGIAIFGDAAANQLDSKGLIGQVVGGGGGDTIFYDAGYGDLVITQADRSLFPNNVLRFGAGVDPADLTISDDGNGNIVFTLANGDTITIENALEAEPGLTWGIQTVLFASGARWTNEHLDAFISGEFAYNPDIGDVTIDAKALPTTGTPVLALDPEIAANEVGVSVGEDALSLILTMPDGAQIMLANALDPALVFDQQIAFGDGAVWTSSDLLVRSRIPSSANVRLAGTATAETFDSLGIARKITGRGGGDTFVYNLGYGQLEIEEMDAAASPSNVLQFGTGIDPDDVRISADVEGNLLLTLSDRDRITLSGALRREGGLVAGVQAVTFANGVTWTYADLLQAVLIPTDENRRIFGDFSSNIVDSEGIARFAAGGGGGDTFRFEPGYGELVIDQRDTSAVPQNRIVFGDGIDPDDVSISYDNWPDLVIEIGDEDDRIVLVGQQDFSTIGVSYGVQRLEFFDGTAIELDRKLIGTNGAEVLDGQGDPVLIEGRGGADTYRFDLGYGELTIRDEGLTGASNVLEFAAGILPVDVEIGTQLDKDIVLYVGADDAVILENALWTDGQRSYGVETIRFNDGTEWSYADLLEIVGTPSVYRSTIYGDGSANVIDGGTTTSLIVAGGGGDTITYNLGYGDLTIVERDTTANPTNKLVFGAGIDPTSVSVSASDLDIQLTLGDGSIVTLSEALFSEGATTHGVQQIDFDNGVSWSYADLLNQLLDPSLGHMTLRGDGKANVFDTQGTANRIVGNGGGDTIIYNAGYGDLAIVEYDYLTPRPNNLLQFGAGILATEVVVRVVDEDVLLELANGDTITLHGAANSEFAGVQSILFGDGTSWNRDDIRARSLIGSATNTELIGTYRPEIIDPNGEAGYVNGNGGNDSILYNAGYGALEIEQGDPNPDANNRLILGAGLDPTTVQVSRDWDDIILDFGNGDVITLVSALYDDEDYVYGVQRIEFSNGTIWSSGDLWAMVNAPTEDEPYIEGREAADVLDSLGIATYLNGRGGGDTIIYKLGYGSLEIDEVNRTGRPNTLAFGTGIQASNVTVTFGGFDGLVLTVNGSDEITLNGVMSSSPGITYGVDRVTFQDGTIWSFSDLIGKANISSAGSGTIRGTRSADILDSLGIASRIEGGGGGDTIIYNVGYGALAVEEPRGPHQPNPPDNVLRLGPGILPANVVVTANANGDLFLDMGGGDVITLEYAYWSNGNRGVQKVVFDDQTTWTYETLKTLAQTASPNNTILYGTSGAETLDGNGYAHEIHGRGGGDTFIFETGDGPLTIHQSQGGQTPVNRLSFGAGILPTSVTATVTSDGHIVLALGGGDSVTIMDGFDSDRYTTYGVQEVTFADGTIWSDVALVGMILASKATSGDDVINGSYFGDTISSGGGNDSVNGRGGDDILTGGLGNDTLVGAQGRDTFVYNQGDGADFISDGNFEDEGGVISFGAGINPTDVLVTRNISAPGDIRLTFNGYAGSLTLTNMAELGAWGPTEIHFNDGTIWDESEILARYIQSQITAGNDSVYGTHADDVINAGNGNDWIIPRGGHDIVDGGAGNDELFGSWDSDTFYGSDGDDRFVPEGGNDALDGGAGRDTADLASLNVAMTIDLALASGQANLGTAGTQTWTNIEKVIAGNKNDTIYGAEIAEDLSGGYGDDTVNGRGGDDFVRGSVGRDILIGGSGNDTLDGGSDVDTADYSAATAAWIVDLSATSAQGTSGTEVDTIIAVENVIGGADDDTITGNSFGNVLEGGDGNDRLRGNAGGDTLRGGLGTDVAVFAGLQASYSIVTGGGSIQIVDNQPSTDGNDGTDTLSGVETAEFKNGVQVSLSPPVVLDLDGDGTELVDRSVSTAQFDWNSDGSRDATGWIGGNDGFLTLDRNGDGTVTNAKELSFVDDKRGAKSDLDGLTTFDSNGDGRLSVGDAAWGDFHVWKDTNGDGVVGSSEYLSMAQAGIQSINLTGAATQQSWGWNDNIVINTGSFVRADGTTSALADVALNYVAGTSNAPAGQISQGWRGQWRTSWFPSIRNGWWREGGFLHAMPETDLVEFASDEWPIGGMWGRPGSLGDGNRENPSRLSRSTDLARQLVEASAAFDPQGADDFDWSIRDQSDNWRVLTGSGRGEFARAHMV